MFTDPSIQHYGVPVTPEVRFGDRYSPIRLLGSGGAGDVYEVLDQVTGNRRALKLLYAGAALDPAMRQRFLSEARIMAELQHPNLLPVFDAGTHFDQIYLVMELAEDSVRAWLEEQPEPPVAEGVHIAIQVLDALDYAHARHIVHRDVKPDNILLTPGGRVKLSDFGVARFDYGDSLHFGLTRTGDHVGTVGYMAPEQRHDARESSPLTDVFAVGVTLYTIATQDMRPPPDLHEMGPDAPLLERIHPQLREIVLRATRTRPKDRYPGARAMRYELERVAKLV